MSDQTEPMPTTEPGPDTKVEPAQPQSLTEHVMQMAQALLAHVRQIGRDGSLVMAAGLEAPAQILAAHLPLPPEQGVPLMSTMLATRHAGFSQSGALVLRGNVDDVARHALHCVNDPRAANPLDFFRIPEAQPPQPNEA